MCSFGINLKYCSAPVRAASEGDGARVEAALLQRGTRQGGPVEEREQGAHWNGGWDPDGRTTINLPNGPGRYYQEGKKEQGGDLKVTTIIAIIL